ncbi:hypothetical protein [Micromonospora chokoriensis]|uniref:hypothetical protein n=1 Tax=Micromonospora chokoriensis TaxID=356851 RepID=UPI0012FBD814|nr:hypothetical protein [Micromonospora chokoriensis]
MRTQTTDEGTLMWRNLINRIFRRRGWGHAATQAWEADDRRAAQQRLLDQARHRQADHRYDGRSD